MRPCPPRTLAITDRRLLSPATREPDLVFERWLGALAERRVEAVQLREKDWPDRRCFEHLRRAVAVRGRRGPGRVLVNGRVDLALAARADGAHLPAAEPAIDRLRRVAGGDGLLIGRSTHRLEEVERARDEGADYVTFGPVFETPSKAAFGPPPGLEELERAVAVGLPVLALGGLTPERVAAVAAAGAHGVAAIRSFHDLTVLDELMVACSEAWPTPHESAGGGETEGAGR